MSALPFEVVWPLHRDHYLTIPMSELGHALPDVAQLVRSSDFRIIVGACDREWRSAIEIQARTEAENIATVSKSLQRAARSGLLQRSKMKISGRAVYGYRKS